jgi:hypothetical protein
VTTDKDSYIDDLSKNSFRRAIVQTGDIIIVVQETIGLLAKELQALRDCVRIQ